MSKIEEVCCYEEAIQRINAEYQLQFPVYLRGIASSRGKDLILRAFTEAGNDAIVKGIENIVEAGTELAFTEEGLPIDRPEDSIKEGIITRVAPYFGVNNTYLLFIPTALRNIQRYAYLNLNQEEQELLALTVLVYDQTKITRMGGVKIALPYDKEERSNSLLKAYVLNTLGH